MAICEACHKIFKKTADLLKCCACGGCYHYECLSIKLQQFKNLSEDYKANWKCPSCVSITRRTHSNLQTPVRSTQLPVMDDTMNMSCDVLEQEPPSPCAANHCTNAAVKPKVSQDLNVDFSDFSHDFQTKMQDWRSDIFNALTVCKEEIKNTLSSWRNELDDSINKLNNEVLCSFRDMRNEISAIRAEQNRLKQQVLDINKDVTDLKTSLDFYIEKQNDLKTQIAETKLQTSEKTELAINSLELKLDSLEQQARQCNVEICNVPELRNENLLQIMEAVGTTVNFLIPPKDIIAIHRVPHAHQQTNRPKNIIVKLSSRILRDNLLAAFRKTKTVTSEQLGFNCNSVSKIYMNEHLTLKKKQLFRKAREFAAQHQYKYVWVHNATILMRERDDLPAIAIRTEVDFKKIANKRNSGSTSKPTHN